MAEIKSQNWVRRFEVSSPKKHKEGFTVYKVTSVVFPRSAPEAATSVVVWKRFNDFKKLYDSLKNNCKQYNVKDLPVLCKGKYFKRFDENVIKDRMNFALELLNYIGSHQVLFTSEPFLQFFDNSYCLTENTFSSDGNSETYLNGNGLNSTGFPSNDIKKNCMSKSSNESLFNNCELSDDDSILRLDTPDSTSPIHSKNFISFSSDSMINSSEGIVEGGKISTVELDAAVNGETVTCRSEKPVLPNEIFLSVRTEDFGTKDGSLASLDVSDSPWSTSGICPEKQDYLVEAAFHVGQAQKYEAEGEFEAAFCFYKAAIACLLSGVQDDSNRSRRQAVREKTNQYLQRAEKIYAVYLAPERQVGSNKLTGIVEDLKVYKVLKVLESVMLVTNTLDGKSYVIKVLQKSSCPVDARKKTTIPYSVPYMVKLIKYFENENSIFLVLEYVEGGKLWDHLNDFSQGAVKDSDDREICSLNYTDSMHKFLNVTKADKVLFKRIENDSIVEKEKNESITQKTVPVIQIQEPKEVFSSKSKNTQNGYESTSMEWEEAPIDLETLEVTNLVKNSQKLLNSVSETLQKSEKLTSNLSKELIDIENVFDLKCKLLGTEKTGVNILDKKKTKKRSRSAVARHKFERSHSTEELLDSRPRTASNSLDRRSEWSKLQDSSLKLPESLIRKWAAELLVALETLHRWGVVCRDLHPGNLLFSSKGHLLLTFQACWKGVESPISEDSLAGFYAAPENMSVYPITSAADWWSFGALLHHLLTGKALSSCYPDGVFGHTVLTFPDYLSPEACSLLRELLRFEPGERLGSGANGAEEIKCHPFFNFVDWQLVYDNS